MTAEIAILNRQGVALAADSAVTVKHPGGQKIYNTVNKLFTLSKYAPVGIMVFGVAELTGLPWETIIKSFRRELGKTRYPHLQGYADRLIEYINDHKIMFTSYLQEQQLLASVQLQFIVVLKAIDSRIQVALDGSGGVSDRQIQQIVTRSIRDLHTYWESADRLPGVPDDHADRLKATWHDQIDNLIDARFEKLPLSRASRDRLHDIAGLVFTANLFPDQVSGVVVAGYGDDEYLPGVIAYDFEGVLLNFVKARTNVPKSHTMNGESASAIVPFAQGEMVSLFMEGIDPRFRRQIANAMNQFVSGLADIMVDSTKATGRAATRLRKQVEDGATKLGQSFVDHLGEYSYNYHIDPVLSAVAHLPKEELAVVAESLVSLTSFKRRVTHAPETVGGPIDVAVISKGDGFIWIHRKHYFDPALNHHFFDTYYQ